MQLCKFTNISFCSPEPVGGASLDCHLDRWHLWKLQCRKLLRYLDHFVYFNLDIKCQVESMPGNYFDSVVIYQQPSYSGSSWIEMAFLYVLRVHSVGYLEWKLMESRGLDFLGHHTFAL